MHPNTNIGISKRKAIWNSQHFCQIRFGFCAFLKRILKAYDGCCKSLREFAHLSEISNKQTNVGSFVVKHTNYFLKYLKQSESLFKTDLPKLVFYLWTVRQSLFPYISRHFIMKYQMKEKIKKIFNNDYVRFVTYYGPLS